MSVIEELGSAGSSLPLELVVMVVVVTGEIQLVWKIGRIFLEFERNQGVSILGGEMHGAAPEICQIRASARTALRLQ